MTTGRPPIPNDRKRAIGTLRADRLPNGEPITMLQAESTAEPPECLEGKGLEF